MTDATETLTIDAFIDARLREDEETARAATTWDEPLRWAADHGRVFEVTDAVGCDDELIASTGVQHVSDGLEPERAAHIARHDPARVLRQCAALRHILQQYQTVWRWSGWSDGQRETFELNLRAIATIWSDHPDFRAEWTA